MSDVLDGADFGVLRPGDTLVIRLDHIPTAEDLDRIRQLIGDDNRVLIFGPDAQLAIVPGVDE